MRLTGLTLCLICLFICLDGGGTVSAQQAQPAGISTGIQGQQALPTQQQTMATEPVRLISPAENVETIGKKPDIKVEINGQLTDLFVMLDGTDVTQLVKKMENGFTYKPVANLAAGAHTLKVSAKDKEGKMVQKEFVFRLKHYGAFDEASSNNQLSVISETYLGKAGYGDTVPYQKVEGNIKSDNKLKKDAWETTLNTNVRYLEQSELPQNPQSRGFDVANWTLTGAYNKETTKAKLSLGDVSVTETPYMVSGLSRKGTVFEGEYGRYQMRTFVMMSEQSFGVNGGIGTDGSMDDHIFGASFGVKLFDKKMEVKAIYANGGDPSANSPASTTTSSSSTYGTTTLPGQKKGEVFGFLVTTNFFKDKLKTEAEAAFSNYNPDTSANGVGSSKDAVYRLKAEGVEGIYSYGASYEYIGRDFGTVGNQGAERDKQRVTYTNGLKFEKQSVNLTLLRANDNVRNDDLFGRNINYNGNLGYAYTGIKNLPMNFNYVKDQQRTNDNPNLRINKDTDTLSGSINYTIGKWNFGFMPAFSYMDDKTPTDADTMTTTYTFTPAYNGESFSASSNLSLNRSFMQSPRSWTDTYTVGFNLRKDFFNKKLIFDTANTFTKTKADNGSTDTKTLNLTGTLTYNLKEYFRNTCDPAIALKSSYLKNTDGVTADNDKEEIRLFLVLTLAVPFLF